MSINALDVMSYSLLSYGSVVDRSQSTKLPTEVAKDIARQQDETGVEVELSQESLLLLKMFQESADNKPQNNDFDLFLLGNHEQLERLGKQADIFDVAPSGRRLERTQMAKQAANYLLLNYYSSGALYKDVSADNPYEALDRQSLSKISFDQSGEFTPVERQLAFYEITDRDMDYIYKVHEHADSASQADDSTARWMVTRNMRDATLASAMSEEERTWRGWATADELSNNASWLAEKHSLAPVILPAYKNLKQDAGNVLVAEVDKGGSGLWKLLDLEHINSDRHLLDLVRAAVEEKRLGERADPNKAKDDSEWVMLYEQISGYRQD